MLDGGMLSMGFAALIVIPLWRIYQRAGLNPAMALSVFVPVFGILIAAAILAFTEWRDDANLRVLDD